MDNGYDRFTKLLGRAALDVCGDMPRDIQEALFETAMKGQPAERKSSRGCCTSVTPGLCTHQGQLEGFRRKPDVNKARASTPLPWVRSADASGRLLAAC